MMLRKCVVIIMALLVLTPALALQAASQMPEIGVSQMPVDIPQEYIDGSNAPGTASYYEAMYRNAVVKNVLEFKRKMDAGRVAFGRQMDSQYFNTRYWEQVYVGGSQFWKVKDGVSKARALDDFISPSGGKYKLDCAAAINLILLKSRLDVVGEKKFSKHLPALIIRGWKTYTVRDGSVEEYQTLEVWSGDEHTPGTPEGLKVGDYVYFKNHPMTEGTPEQGENAIYLGLDRWGRPLFFGLNIGIHAGMAHQYGILTTERGTIDPEALKRMAES